MIYSKKYLLLLSILIILFILGYVNVQKNNLNQFQKSSIQQNVKKYYSFVLHRKSNREELFHGIPGDQQRSVLAKTFVVKTGIPNQRPTPLPKLVGKEYWIIIEKHPEPENPETAPYFLTLNIPAPTGPPYGPKPYTECNGQCDWVMPGDFGLHGIGGNPQKLSTEDKGSSGCIRHKDEDITYLYNLLDVENNEVRYYVEDN